MQKLLFGLILTLLLVSFSSAQPATSAVQTIEIKSPAAEAEVGKPLKFTAIVKDATGKVLTEKPSAWFAAPFDLAAADDEATSVSSIRVRFSSARSSAASRDSQRSWSR